MGVWWWFFNRWSESTPSSSSVTTSSDRPVSRGTNTHPSLLSLCCSCSLWCRVWQLIDGVVGFFYWSALSLCLFVCFCWVFTTIWLTSPTWNTLFPYLGMCHTPLLCPRSHGWPWCLCFCIWPCSLSDGVPCHGSWWENCFHRVPVVKPAVLWPWLIWFSPLLWGKPFLRSLRCSDHKEPSGFMLASVCWVSCTLCSSCRKPKVKVFLTLKLCFLSILDNVKVISKTNHFNSFHFNFCISFFDLMSSDTLHLYTIEKKREIILLLKILTCLIAYNKKGTWLLSFSCGAFILFFNLVKHYIYWLGHDIPYKTDKTSLKLWY